MSWSIVKVGGSLYDWPNLGERLNAWLAQLHADHILLVPGGGAMADAIRALDHVHRLGEETSHWLAIQAMSLNARFLQKILPHCEMIADLDDLRSPCHRLHLLDAYPFFAADEKRREHLPHQWCVTSDSLAVRVAALTHAEELILLKSSDWTGNAWAQATLAGMVDGYFTDALKQAPATMRARIINLRRWVDDGTIECDTTTL